MTKDKYKYKYKDKDIDQIFDKIDNSTDGNDGDIYGDDIYGGKIAICTMVRNEERGGNLKRFLECLQELEEYHDSISRYGKLGSSSSGKLGSDGLVYIFLEGDSSDDTYEILKEWLEKKTSSGMNREYLLEKLDKGYGKFGKTKDSRRTKYFADLRNRLVDLALWVSGVNLIFMIDASYEFRGDIITKLMKTMVGKVGKDGGADGGADIAVPMNHSRRKDHTGKQMWYDTWASRKDGKEFRNIYPYYDGLEDHIKSGKPVKLDSCGGVYLIKRSVFDSDNGFVRYDGRTDCEHAGFCKRVREKGFVIKLDPKVYVVKEGWVDL